MIDSRNIQRGACKDCGIDECIEYQRSSDETINNCAYCCCPVTKHERLSDVNVCKNPEWPLATGVNESTPGPNATAITTSLFLTETATKDLKITNHPVVTTILNSQKATNNPIVITKSTDTTAIMTSVSLVEAATNDSDPTSFKILKDTNNLVEVNLNRQKSNDPASIISKCQEDELVATLSKSQMDYEINPKKKMPQNADYGMPVFSNFIKKALEDGTVTNGQSWHVFISECCFFYSKNTGVCTRTAYTNIGSNMYQLYPSIKLEGTTPWEKFTKSLSAKIRKQRIIEKSEEIYEAKGFKRLASAKTGEDQNPKCKISKSSKPVLNGFSRNQYKGENITGDQEKDCIKKIQYEWKKGKPDMGVIKANLKKTFITRTNLINLGKETFLENYPCFETVEVFLFEFRLMCGKELFENISKNVKKIFNVILDLSKEKQNKEQDLMFLGWNWFVKKSGNFQTKGVKTTSIVERVKDSEILVEMSRRTTGPPLCLVAIENSHLEKAIIVGNDFQVILKENELSLPTIMMTLLSIYYTQELDYPETFLQPMALLAKWVMNHSYYKLGTRAAKLDVEIKKIWHNITE